MSDNQKGCLTFIVVVFLIIAAPFVKAFVLPLFIANQMMDTTYGAIDKTLDADNAIYNYEWFKSQYQAVVAQKEKMEQVQQEYDTYKETIDKDSAKWTKFQQQEEASIRNALSANKKVLADLIAEYNAKSSMVNRSIFKQGLPERLEME